ncbi:MAG: helix-turn-helix transcriptional regulator [Ruminococcus sp.]
MEYETILFRPELLAAENDACYARFLQPFFAETQEIAPVLTPECRNYPAISVLLERIDTLCDARPYGYPLAVKGCLFQMFYEIISAERTETEHSLDRKSLAKIKEILSYIADNYSRPISIAEIASACFYSESYFMKFFKHAMGTSFVQYLNSYRLEKAAKRLRDTSDTILQVAMETGFDSLSYFNRCFKKCTAPHPENTGAQQPYMLLNILSALFRARVHRRLSTSFRQILLHTALKILAIRKYACKFLPCLQKNLLENPHIFPMNTSS